MKMAYSLLDWRNRLPQNGVCVPADFEQLVQQVLGESHGGTLHPGVNIEETDAGYQVSLDLPGVKPADVSIDYVDGKLSVAGERVSPEPAEGVTVHRSERRYGKFERVVTLPKQVNVENIEATYEDGVLTISLPKSEELRPRKIEIKAARKDQE